MADLSTKYPQFKSRIQRARNAGYGEAEIEASIRRQIGGSEQSVGGGDNLTFVGALQQNFAADTGGFLSKIPVVGPVVEGIGAIVDFGQDALFSGIGAAFDIENREGETGSFLERFARGESPSDLLPKDATLGAVMSLPFVGPYFTGLTIASPETGQLVADTVVDAVLDPAIGLEALQALRAGKVLRAERAATRTVEQGSGALERLVPSASRAASPLDEIPEATTTVRAFNDEMTVPEGMQDFAVQLRQEIDTNVGKTPGESVAIAKPSVARDVTEATIEEANRAQEAGSFGGYIKPGEGDAPPLYAQTAFAIERGDIRGEAIIDNLVNRGYTKAEATRQLLLRSPQDVRVSAQVLRAQQSNARMLNRLTKDDPEVARLVAELEGAAPNFDTPSFMSKATGAGGKLFDWWRGSLVSQFSTAARNAIVFGGRVGLDVLQSSFDAAFQIVSRAPRTAHPLDSMGTALNILQEVRGNPLKGRGFVKVLRDANDPKLANTLGNRLLKQYPKQWDRMYANYNADIVATTGNAGDKWVHFINTFNRAQEWLTRRSVFQAKVVEGLRATGKSSDEIEQILRTGTAKDIAETDIAKHVDTALEFTFGNQPKSQVANEIIRAVNKIPLVGLLIPFPRFLMNSMKFFFDFSPVGFTKLVRRDELVKIAKGDTQAISRAAVGTMLLGAAFQIRDSEYAGERWYELTVGDETYDMRPFNPFAAYLFAADVVKRAQENRLSSFDSRDVLMGVLSSNIRAGTGLYIIDTFLDGFTGVDNTEKAGQRLAELAGEYLGGFATPFQQLNDIYKEFNENARVVRNTRTDTVSRLLGPTLTRVPGGEQFFPEEAQLPTREGPLVTQNPLMKQITGLRAITPKNTAEKELDRLGFARSEVRPTTGDSEADALIDKALGPLVERVIGNFVNSPQYENLSELQRGRIIRDLLVRVRGTARRMAMAQDPQLFRKLAYKRKPRRERRALEELGVRQ